MNDLTKALKSASSRFRATRSDLVWAQERQHVLALIKQSKNLKQATPESVGDAMVQAASMGLSFNRALQFCYLIPRKARRRKQGEPQKDYDMVPVIAYASPSYRGLSDVCQRSGKVEWIRAEVVFRQDRFVYQGPAEKPVHVPTLEAKHRKESAAYGVYAMAKMSSGDFLCEFVDREMIQKIRNMSEFPNSIMWHPDKLWTQGWKKSAIRRLTNTLPKSAALDAAISQLNAYEGAHFEESDEPELCITEEKVTELHAMLTDKSMDNQADQWLGRLARRFGVNKIADLPESRFENAKAALNAALERK